MHTYSPSSLVFGEALVAAKLRRGEAKSQAAVLHRLQNLRKGGVAGPGSASDAFCGSLRALSHSSFGTRYCGPREASSGSDWNCSGTNSSARPSCQHGIMLDQEVISQMLNKEASSSVR